MRSILLILLASAACSRQPPVDMGPLDAAAADAIAVPDASAACLTSSGESGACMATADCALIADHVSVAHACPGPADIQCCVATPSVADNPPVPAGYRLMAQAEVTPEMTTWAVAILHDPVGYPLFATATRLFGTLSVLARVEWHPPDFQNSVVHRGVTLYVPT